MPENKSGNFIKWFKDISISDIPLVGGKNAGLGEMFSTLGDLGINVPNGFAITSQAYSYFLEKSGIKDKIADTLKDLNANDLRKLQEKAGEVRNLILNATIPDDLASEIVKNYHELCEFYHEKNLSVAIRSSATAEDLPDASFAGQQETFLHISSPENVLEAVKKCFASLFKDRAISYRADKGFSRFKISLSVGVQKMVRSNKACSGIIFTLDTETGFDKVIIINGSYGLGETIVQGQVNPDEFVVFKPSLERGFKAILEKKLGKKDVKLIYADEGTKRAEVEMTDRLKFCLNDQEIYQLANWSLAIEKHFSKVKGHYQPMDIEWAKDGVTEKLFIVQARPETVISSGNKNIYKEYKLLKKGKVLITGSAVGTKIASGKVKVIKDADKINQFKKGEVLVTDITDPDWEPIMKIAAAIITNRGGRTSHAAIVSRELGIPCVVGTNTATEDLPQGKEVTVDCSSGEVGQIFEGALKFEILEHHLDKIPKTHTKIMVNIGSPEEASQNWYLPVNGVGLGRLEFIINSHIGIHPNFLIDFEKNQKDNRLREITAKVERLTSGYKDKKQYYVDKLSEGIAKIAAVFWPNEVIIRFSDFKTNEYRTLLGGQLYEPIEENPMLGWRGASRYYDPKFKEAFKLECQALKRAREDFGLVNIVPMIPFCRTPEEAQRVIEEMQKSGLDRKSDKQLKIYIMCEIPSNILLSDRFLAIFDGMSIGSNDLTQLVLGLDRDSDLIRHIANENSPAVVRLIGSIIDKCNQKGKYIGICGQAPSDFPEFATMLVEKGIKSISLNPDTVIKTLEAVAAKEKLLKK